MLTFSFPFFRANEPGREQPISGMIALGITRNPNPFRIDLRQSRSAENRRDCSSSEYKLNWVEAVSCGWKIEAELLNFSEIFWATRFVRRCTSIYGAVGYDARPADWPRTRLKSTWSCLKPSSILRKLMFWTHDLDIELETMYFGWSAGDSLAHLGNDQTFVLFNIQRAKIMQLLSAVGRRIVLNILKWCFLKIVSNKSPFNVAKLILRQKFLFFVFFEILKR